MKKIIFSALAVLVGAFIFVSCSKESQLEKNIVGTWEVSRVYYSDEGEWYDCAFEWEATCTYVFKDNGKGSYTWKYDDGDKETYSFEYNISDDKLAIRDEDDDRYSYTIESLNNKKMVWKDRDGDKTELKKK